MRLLNAKGFIGAWLLFGSPTVALCAVLLHAVGCTSASAYILWGVALELVTLMCGIFCRASSIADAHCHEIYF